MGTEIPVIDLSAYGLDQEKPNEERLASLAMEVHEALTTTGFMYLKNSGVSSQAIEDAFRFSEQFFNLPQEEKMRVERFKEDWAGYVGYEGEVLNTAIPFKDLKEVFNFVPSRTDQPFPDDTLPEFRRSMKCLYDEITPVYKRILEVVARGMKLEDPLHFVKSHQLVGKNGNITTLRTVYYPPLIGVPPKEGQLRCGEHDDWECLSLIFQDDQPGLEMKTRQGEWVPARPLDGSVVVIVGDTMQMWTGDIYKATLHRVSLPADEAARKQARRSLIYFGAPDKDAVIQSVNDSMKYPPMAANAHIDEMIEKSNIAATR